MSEIYSPYDHRRNLTLQHSVHTFSTVNSFYSFSLGLLFVSAQYSKIQKLKLYSSIFELFLRIFAQHFYFSGLIFPFISALLVRFYKHSTYSFFTLVPAVRWSSSVRLFKWLIYSNTYGPWYLIICLFDLALVKDDNQLLMEIFVSILSSPRRSLILSFRPSFSSLLLFTSFITKLISVIFALLALFHIFGLIIWSSLVVYSARFYILQSCVLILNAPDFLSFCQRYSIRLLRESFHIIF